MINFNLNRTTAFKMNQQPSFKGATAPYSEGGIIITDLENHHMVLTPDGNRKKLTQAVDSFESTLIKENPIGGDHATLENLQDANTAFTLAAKLQEIGSKLLNKAKGGIKEVHDRPFDEEHPKRTPVEADIIRLEKVVGSQAKATQPISVVADKETIALIDGANSILLNSLTDQNKQLKGQLDSHRGAVKSLINTAQLLDLPDPEDNSQIN